ncbi:MULTISPECIES: DUF2790 domain-containing protein [Pseudomonas]|uniref:DUF2790 domain-containing protein n=1 Tax=Pseudomonas TaxID=286 RepID=UPI0018AC5856|nr:DUF2790 domain-containing protein [Pseudomonas guariconensis]MBF8739667.1 DUF2790 domain-containing protein [Pseudomonas guariconensis]MBF8749189.1 DUF2790 domain-containing protein [Pseudomonas guariconensis]MBF8792583.1 DUF2790 domain-containing protein [Pseudomonas monteilii]
MTAKTFATAAFFALFGFAALGAQASSMPMDDSVMQYRYGDRLDVSKVLSIKDDQRNACGIVTTRMDYLDSHGERQSVEYRTYATGGCHES